MIRRVASVAGLILGGWMLSGGLTIAFLDLEMGTAANLIVPAVCDSIAAVFLLLGAWASPGNRWRELGLTVLIAAGLTTTAAATILLMANDPAMTRFFPPDAFAIEVAPAIGLVHLLLVSGLGWLAYRTKPATRAPGA